MSKNYKTLWVFGDSFTTPNFMVPVDKSFWGLTATHLQINVINNCSRSGNSFDTVYQLLIGLQKQIDWENDLIFIGVPPLERITVFDNFRNTGYYGNKINPHTWEIEQFDVSCHRGLVCLQHHGDNKELVIHSDRSWLETQTLRTIFLLTQWLDRYNANYLIINLSKDLDKNNIWGPSEFVFEYCLNHDRCILFDKTYQSINIGVNKPVDYKMFEWHGHHGPDGNMYFFEKSLLPKLIECNLT